MSKYMPFINIPNVEMKSSKLKPMNKTKYIKIAVEERLPKNDGNYHCLFQDGSIFTIPFNKEYSFHEDFTDCSGITHWLEESPDREDEMIEMLERTFNLCDKLQFPTEKQLSDLKTEIKSLLQSLKQEK